MATEKEIISYVLSVCRLTPFEKLSEYMKTLSDVTESLNLDGEFILVIKELDDNLRKEIANHSANLPMQLVVVGGGNSWDQEIFAGLSRANGDYILILGNSAFGLASIIPNLLSVARREDCDVIGIKGKVKLHDKIRNLHVEILFRILRKRTKTPLFLGNYRDILITRKALNWILRDFSTALCILEIHLIPGIKFQVVPALESRERYKLSREMHSRLFMRYTKAPLLILKSCFYISLLLISFVAFNAILVRLRGFNILNQSETQVPGWTTLVLLVGFGFAIIIYALYVLIRIILHLAEEYSSKPDYIIKSVQRP